MKHTLVSILLLATTALAGCTSSAPDTSNTDRRVATPTVSPGTRPTQAARAPSADGTLPVAPAHGGSAPPQASPPGADQSVPDTSAFDAKIAEAENKARAKGATSGDKETAAAAYVERGNVFYAAGQPRLYKFALGDFRRALRYDPNNGEARAKLEQIVGIYQSMGRPVPDNGTEP